MDKPKQCAVIEEMGKKEESRVPLYALFTDEVLTVTEGTKITTDIIVTHTYGNNDLVKETSQTIRLYDRNAMTWDDDRKAAAFITAKDPEILRFSKNVAGLVREHHNKAVNLNFRIGMGLFEAVSLYGVNYVIDPQTPYTEFSKNELAIDYLQFPLQTLGYKAGDCDDLAILFCTILESTGIETAFITVPGHIFMAFSLGMALEEAKKLFLTSENLIYREGTTWLPVEITLVNEGFLRAWETGAKEWREHSVTGNTGFFPIHQAWEEYKPVGVPESGIRLELPQESDIVAHYAKTVSRFVEREIAAEVQRLTDAINKRNSPPHLVNALGVLYAKYGLLEKAKEHFLTAAASEYHPAMINVGNVLYLENKMDEALAYYTKVQEVRPDNVQALVGIAKASYELENHGTVRRTYDQIKHISPMIAERFSYLISETEETGRASAAMIREQVLWFEETE